MVFIDKSGHPIPVILTTVGVTRRDEHIADFVANEAGYRDGSKNGSRFNFDSDIYGDSTVKKPLEIIQNYKCCFCESKYKHITSGDVEHFRPKAAYTQGKGGTFPFVRPGYFWLAYEWDNLLVSCEVCNQRKKGNYFPIKNRIRRCQDHTFDYNQEEPWFINPSEIDPVYHISFYKEVPTHITHEGAKTIHYLGLDRQELNEIRNDKLNNLKRLEDAYNIAVGTALENRLKNNFFDALREVLHNNGEYFLMIKVNFNKYISEL
jgi:hypothetical protein